MAPAEPDHAALVNRVHFDRYWNPWIRAKSRLQFNAAFTRELVDCALDTALATRNRQRVLDVGFGLGQHFLLFPPDCTLSGTEISERALALAGEDLQRRGFSQVRLKLAVLPNRLDFSEGEFDVVICSHVIEHLSDDMAMLAEVRRVLRPGGIAVIQIPLDRFESSVLPDDDLVNSGFAAGLSDHVRAYNAASFSARLGQADLDVTYQLCAGRVMDALAFVESRFRRHLRRHLAPLDLVLSAVLNVPLALLPFPLKLTLDRLLRPLGLRCRYGVWVVRKRK